MRFEAARHETGPTRDVIGECASGCREKISASSKTTSRTTDSFATVRSYVCKQVGGVSFQLAMS